MSTPRRPEPRSSAAPMITMRLAMVGRSSQGAGVRCLRGATVAALKCLSLPGSKPAFELRVIPRHAVEGPTRQVHERLDLRFSQRRSLAAVVQLAGTQRLHDVPGHPILGRPLDAELPVLVHG